MNCHPCQQRDWSLPSFAEIVSELKHPFMFHRKLWEMWFIIFTLRQAGMLTAGKRGIGFGVGREMLPAYFNSLGCEILATDQNAETAGAWAETGQHAMPGNHKNFRALDMRAIPPDLTGFDFCWSACALEHLGTPDAGMKFAIDSLNVLRPGGFAVHTTEYMFDDAPQTGPFADGITIYHRRDIEQLETKIDLLGHTMAPLKFDVEKMEYDNVIDEPPWKLPHIRLRLNGLEITSFGLVIRKSEDA